MRVASGELKVTVELLFYFKLSSTRYLVYMCRLSIASIKCMQGGGL